MSGQHNARAASPPTVWPGGKAPAHTVQRAATGVGAGALFTPHARGLRAPPPPRAVAEELVARPGGGFQVRSDQRQHDVAADRDLQLCPRPWRHPARPAAARQRQARACPDERGRPIVYAGTARFDRGDMAWWSNYSGATSRSPRSAPRPDSRRTNSWRGRNCRWAAPRCSAAPLPSAVRLRRPSVRPRHRPARRAKPAPGRSQRRAMSPPGRPGRHLLAAPEQRDRGGEIVEDGRGSLGHSASLRFPSPLIEPDVRLSRIRLSDWLHRKAHGGAVRGRRSRRSRPRSP